MSTTDTDATTDAADAPTTDPTADVLPSKRRKSGRKLRDDGKDLLAPLQRVQFVDRDRLRANDYNPNVVNEQNLALLEQSILSNGWTLPIVVRDDFTIIDGFHRWTVAGREPLRTRLGGKVPVVVVSHDDRGKDIFGTITHNRARGVHQLEPMKAIVAELLDQGKTVEEIGTQTGMRPEEVFRLAGFTREDFLKRMIGTSTGYSKAVYMARR